MVNEADPIWGEMPAQVSIWADGGREVKCSRTGHYYVTGSALAGLPNLSIEERAKLTTLIVDTNRYGEPLTVNSYTFDHVRAMRSLTVSERMDRLMAYFVHRGFRPGSTLVWLGGHTQTPETVRSRHEACAWIEAQDENELGSFRELLEGVGLLRNSGSGITITAAGFARMDELRGGGAPTKTAFIAMWFGTEMTPIYEEGIAPAVSETGFEPLRIDRKEHIRKIDDEIVAEIRRSRFIIADFTSPTIDTAEGPLLVPRGGVYYEAGLAQGLSIPVIWSVRSDQIEHVHFDTRQFNHIVWSNAQDFYTKLRNRIRALFPEAK
ncbi:MAG TPA: hypothetical protein VF620_00510 [Allosphingosinicella sp.]|jgi:hypothetical protein